MSTRNIFKLSDQVIAQLRQLLQLAMLTGTNVVDHMRQMRLELDVEEGGLVCTPEYLEYCNKSIEKLLEKAEFMKAALEAEENLPADKPVITVAVDAGSIPSNKKSN